MHIHERKDDIEKILFHLNFLKMRMRMEKKQKKIKLKFQVDIGSFYSYLS